MQSYEFTFIASGVDPESSGLEDRFYEAGCDDATLSFMKGLLAVNFDREAETYVHAVVSAYHSVVKAGVTVERFEPDFLVSASEIATRSNQTRQAISNYTKGLRGEKFPAPIARISSESPLWDWVEVSSWLFKKELVSRKQAVDARVARTMNIVVQSREQFPDSEKRLVAMLNTPVQIGDLATA